MEKSLNSTAPSGRIPNSSGTSGESLFQSKLFWLVLFSFGLLLHVVAIRQPFLGNFAQHQTDYATVVQRWLATSIDPFHPLMRFLALGKNRLFYGDFPLNISVIALICKATGLSIEMAGRGLSVLFFLISLYPFYQMALRATQDQKTARLALFFYLFSPLTLIYGQAFLLEMSALSLGIWGYYFFMQWADKSSIFSLLLSAFFLSWMLATRIYFAPVLLPLAFLFFGKLKWKAFWDARTFFFLFFLLLLPVIWQLYAGRQAALQGDESSLKDNLRVFVTADTTLKESFKSLQYYAAISSIFFTKVVTPAGFFLALLAFFMGLKGSFSRIKYFCVMALLSFAPLFILASRKFVEFEYYYLPLVPFFSLLAALAVSQMIRGDKLKGKGVAALVILTVLFSLRYSLPPLLKVPDKEKNILNAARQMEALAPLDAKVIASQGSSTAFLYYTNRDGWAFLLDDKVTAVRNQADFEGTAVDRLERFRSQGAEYFALADKRDIQINPAFFDYLNQRYRVVYESPESLIYSLHPKA